MLLRRPRYRALGAASHPRLVRSAVSTESRSALLHNQEWLNFRPTVEKLVAVHCAFYRRSTSLKAAKEWESLVQEGWLPATRPPWDVNWWRQERQSGRVQDDRVVGRPLVAEDRRLRRQQNSTAPSPTAHSAQRHVRPMSTWSHNCSPSSLVYQHRLHSTVSSQASAQYIKTSPFAAAEAALALESYSPPDFSMSPLDDDGPLVKTAAIVDADPEIASQVGYGVAKMRPGSFVEVHRAGQQSTGILLKMRGAGVYYLSNLGTVHLADLNDVMFAVHNIVDESVAHTAWPDYDAPLATTFGPTEDEAQTNARRQCALAVTNLQISLEQREAALVEGGFASLHPLYRHNDPRRLGTLQTRTAVIQLLGPRSADALNVYALHRLLMADSQNFLADARSMREQSRFLVRPSCILEDVERVREMMIAESTEFLTFLDKARQLIDWYRDSPLETKSGSRPESPPYTQWTQNDRPFLTILTTTVGFTRRVQEDAFESLVSTIVKRIGRHDHLSTEQRWPPWPLDKFAATLLLRELGIMAPWQCADMWSDECPLRDYHTPPFTAQLYKEQNAKLPAVVRTGFPDQKKYSPDRSGEFKTPGREVLHPITKPLGMDALQDQRTDFGDTKVYIIDSAEAQELDDGVSITNITDDSAWLHVHVADPTAHLAPSELIAQEARFRLGSLYDVGTPFSMLPQEWIRLNKVSLGSADPQEGNKTLTFSAKVNIQTGTVEDYKVEVGVVRNLKVITYEAAARAIGEEENFTSHQYMYSGSRPEATENSKSDELSETEQTELRLLHKFSEALKGNRVRAGALSWHFPTTEVSLFTPAAQPLLLEANPRYAESMPSVRLKLPRPWTPDNRVQWSTVDYPIVPELMILGGRIAARFCMEKGIPIAYRGQIPTELDENQLKQLRSTETNGNVDFLTAAQMRFKPVASFHSSSPQTHQPLGIDDGFGYCRATSPLRRYEDLVTHWQIKHALLSRQSPHELENFNVADIDILCRQLDLEGKSLSKLQKRISNAWSAFVLSDNLSRLEHSPNTVDNSTRHLLNNLEGIVLQNPTFVRLHHLWTIRLYIPSLGMRGSLQLTQMENWFEGCNESRLGGADGVDLVGTSVPVKIKVINPEDHIILELDPTRMHLLRQLLQ